jgi:hydrogenase nickel incorporation protein HypA/HybF
VHEFAIVKRLLEIALETSRAHGDAPIERVLVEIGALRQVVPSTLEFAFRAASAGTAAEGADMDWTLVPAEILCGRCESAFTPASVFWVCPSCGATGGRAIKGNDLVLKTVTLHEVSAAR